MKYDMVAEGRAEIAVPKYKGRVVSSAMPVFYNPVMKSNRDVTMLLLAAAAKIYGTKKWRVADPFAATGVRGIRMMLELGSSRIEALKMNDYSAAAVRLIKKNLRLNRIKPGKNVAVANEDASRFLLLGNTGFNYIDIDPFGYPGTFLDAAVKKISHNGILAVTATDTSALAGAAQAACQRKYLATPLKNGFMHETGLRILVRLVQLIGAMHEKALQPVFSYYKEHYVRAFLLCREGAGKADKLLKMHREIAYCKRCCEKKVGRGEINLSCSNCGKKMLKAGPLWVGNLFDKKLAAAMSKAAQKSSSADKNTRKFMKVVAEEATAEAKCGESGVGFYSIEDICEKHRIGQQPKTSDVVARLKKMGYSASQTHCSTTGVKTNATLVSFVAAAKVGSDSSQ